MNAYQEHYDFEYATDSELDNAEASEIGYFNEDSAWILTDRDVWHMNPYYRGLPVPHPEYDMDFQTAEEYNEWVMAVLQI